LHTRGSRTAAGADVTRWLSPAEAARRLGVSVQSVQDWVDAGRLRAIRTSLGRLVDPSSIAELSAARQGAAKSGVAS
jgi:excisionase family DNA binding protein